MSEVQSPVHVEPAAPGLIARLIGVLFSPRATYAAGPIVTSLLGLYGVIAIVIAFISEDVR